MYTTQNIIEIYCQTDCEHRLSLFLEYPSLRGTFIEIDRGEYEPVDSTDDKIDAVVV